MGDKMLNPLNENTNLGNNSRFWEGERAEVAARDFPAFFRLDSEMPGRDSESLEVRVGFLSSSPFQNRNSDTLHYCNSYGRLILESGWLDLSLGVWFHWIGQGERPPVPFKQNLKDREWFGLLMKPY